MTDDLIIKHIIGICLILISGTMNVFTNFNDDPSSCCQNISDTSAVLLKDCASVIGPCLIH